MPSTNRPRPVIGGADAMPVKLFSRSGVEHTATGRILVEVL